MTQPERRRVSLTIPAAQLAEARRQRLNLSRVLEDALDVRLGGEQARKWQDDNREAIAQYNAYIEQHGCFSDRYRTF